MFSTSSQPSPPSHLRDRVTLAVLELIEKGELANLEKKWWYEKGECSRDGVPKKVPYKSLPMGA